MNYKKIYIDLVLKVESENRLKLKRDNENFIYYERHHIIPKCLGGENSADNLVLLTAREHFVAHKLLVEIYPNESGLIYSLLMLSTRKINNGNIIKDFVVSSREYERIKISSAQLKSGVPRSEETLNKMKATRAENPPPPRSAEAREAISKRLTGITRSQETRDKMSEAKTGTIFSEEHLRKLSIAKLGTEPWNKGLTGIYPEERLEKLRQLGREKVWTDEMKEKLKISKESQPTLVCEFCGHESKNAGVMSRCHGANCKQNPDYEDKRPTLICPYCGIEGKGVGNMKSHHFDRCKQNPNRKL